MSDEMYFMPIIARALRQADPESAMRDALERIESMGRDPQYSDGYQQFLRFMAVAGEEQWQQKPQQLWTELCKAFDRSSSVQILVERDRVLVAACSFELLSGVQSVGDITQGAYQISLDTGRVLWQGHLTAQDLLWAKAFPGEPLRMAADTDQVKQRPVREISLLEGALTLRIYPGVEAGSLEIELNTSGSKE